MKKCISRWLGIILMCLSFDICQSALATQQITLEWGASNSSDVNGYFVYSGSSSGIYTNKLDVSSNLVDTISGLQEGKTYYFAVTAYNAARLESSPSNEIQYIAPGLVILAAANAQSVNLQFPVVPGHWYEIQASTDLKNWTTIGQTSLAVDNLWLQFTDLQSSQFNQRFYRLIMH